MVGWWWAWWSPWVGVRPCGRTAPQPGVARSAFDPMSSRSDGRIRRHDGFGSGTEETGCEGRRGEDGSSRRCSVGRERPVRRGRRSSRSGSVPGGACGYRQRVRRRGPCAGHVAARVPVPRHLRRLQPAWVVADHSAQRQHQPHAASDPLRCEATITAARQTDTTVPRPAPKTSPAARCRVRGSPKR